MFEFVLPSVETTLLLGNNLARHAYPGLVLLLYGELGTGKTHISKGIGLALGYKDVRSPTFTIMNRYEEICCGFT